MNDFLPGLCFHSHLPNYVPSISYEYFASKFKHNCSNFFYIFLVHHIHARMISCNISFLFFVVLLLLFYHQNNKPLWQTGKDKWMLIFYCLFVVKSGFQILLKSVGIFLEVVLNIYIFFFCFHENMKYVMRFGLHKNRPKNNQ